MSRSRSSLMAPSARFAADRRMLAVVVALSACVCGLVWTFASAGATSVLPQLGSFGSQGTGSGQFRTPEGVAVDNSTGASKGDVYVSDDGNQRVQKFGAAGNFILMFGKEVNETKVNEFKEAGNPHGVQEYEENSCTAVSGDTCKAGSKGSSGEGQFNFPTGVAVDPTSGSVYVVDEVNHRVQKFSPEGRFELMFGGKVNATTAENVCRAGEVCKSGELAIVGEEGKGKFHKWHIGSFVAVGSSGVVYVGDENSVQEFNNLGEYQQQITLSGFGSVTALAVNASGDVFVRAFEKAGVHEYNSMGNELHEYAAEKTEAVAVDPVNGDLYVAGEAGHYVLQYEGLGSFSLVAKVPQGFLESSHGLGIGKHSTLYAADTRNAASADKILIFGKPPVEGLGGAPAPTIGAARVSQDGTTAAQVTIDNVNPHFLEGEYYVQYGSEASYGQTSLTLHLASTIEQSASVVLKGLEPESEYHYQFVVKTSSGTTYGPDETFVTDAEGITGLPDGRVYEQVTPPFKNGNFFDPITGFMMGVAEAGGNGVLYPMSGAVGTSDAGLAGEYVSRRVPGTGWSTAQAASRPVGEITIKANPAFVLPSAGFGSFLFASDAPFTTEEPFGFKDASSYINVFLGESVGGAPPTSAQWLSGPRTSHPVPVPGEGPGAPVGDGSQNYAIAGTSPDLSRVYFGYAGTLLPEDEERAKYVGSGLEDGRGSNILEVDPWGFYEWHDGALEEAGTLPDGKLNPFGAIPAALGLGNFTEARAGNFQAADFDNVVSTNGTRSVFVSPDPLASTVTDPEGCGHDPTKCTSEEAPELYVREMEAGKPAKVKLVSQSQLPGSEGHPALDGVVSIPNGTYGSLEHGGATYAYPSPDGSHVFFASVDRLTTAAPENNAVKEYDYNVETGTLSYLPGVEGSIGAVGDHGETFLFMETKETPWTTAGERELKVWSAGADGGTVMQVASLSDAVQISLATKAVLKELAPRVRSVHVSKDGNVFVFSTDSPIAGYNNRGVSRPEDISGLQVYRFEIAKEKLDCLSCPPKGVQPVGDAYMSYNNFESHAGEEVGHQNGAGGGNPPQTTQETRGVSADGSRVFFDTPSPLVAQAVNGKRDVYEWEDGHVYLLSSGAATQDSYYLDSSESGGDVFFATSAGLVPGDTDEAYDVYDARVPRPGDSPAVEVPPCKGSVCQGPPNVPQLLGAPSSETFSGAGPLPPAAEAKTAVKPKMLTRAQRLARALQACHKKRNRRRRVSCERLARKRYGARIGKSSRAAKASRRGAGR